MDTAPIKQQITHYCCRQLESLANCVWKNKDENLADASYIAPRLSISNLLTSSNQEMHLKMYEILWWQWILMIGCLRIETVKTLDNWSHSHIVAENLQFSHFSPSRAWSFILFSKCLDLHLSSHGFHFNQQEGRYIVSQNLKLDLKIERHLSHLHHIYTIH